MGIQSSFQEITFAIGGAGGAPGTGLVRSSGSPGAEGIIFFENGAVTSVQGGNGGASVLGDGALAGHVTGSVIVNSPPMAGGNYGGGGSGAFVACNSTTGSPATAGGAGGPGIVIVTEYF